MTDSKIGIFSFFAGAGFLDLGFETTGKYDVLFVNEYHKAFMDIYKGARANLDITGPKYGHEVKDITEYLKPEELKVFKDRITQERKQEKLIGFIGGPPCPDFSVGGKNRGHEGENGKLSGTYVELICTAKPDFFLFENVKGLYRTVKHREFFESMKNKLKDAGYYLTEQLINSVEFGAPQDRQRIILIGFHKNILRGTGTDKSKDHLLTGFDWEANKTYSTENIAAAAWPATEPFREEGEREAPEKIIRELTVQHWFDRNDVTNHPNGKHHFTPRNGLTKFLSISEGDDLKKSYKRLHRWRYSPTAAYGNNEVHLHPYKPRRISVAEALAIQSLPKEFVIPQHISLTDMFKTIGNGVPYLAAKGLALNISDFLGKIMAEKNIKSYATADSE
ncbi:DNA cytosine methyltransferase [Mucilaginibacter jinjuensis]|uniref:DNA (cytosine-5-)-methyltransferase n=1 Tax=Mucilaginibacter jinjuensis TaxID=1176721 RepID=A0ABY7TDL7_9SPHI|nr:DNA cytosine methyltransferase [Mucilaginibacter jinjuensis]WCT13793.1 DNA cytosine methyltransferase [Mucilaginibacter jinjuensis]